jgi:hypothetical protein
VLNFTNIVALVEAEQFGAVAFDVKPVLATFVVSA